MTHHADAHTNTGPDLDAVPERRAAEPATAREQERTAPAAPAAPSAEPAETERMTAAAPAVPAAGLEPDEPGGPGERGGPPGGPVPERAGDAAPEDPPRPAKARDPFFDNAKFLAIMLVVVGHGLVQLRDVQLAHTAYLFIYMFHMPVFIVMTGYLSRNFTFAKGKARKLITKLAVPYVLFEIAYSIVLWHGKGDFELSLLDPSYLTWFLMALLFWRLSTPVWQQIRWPLAISVGVSLASGLGELSRDLELNRVLGLVPFYVLGLTLRAEHFELLRRRAVRILGAAVLVAGMGVAVIVDRHMATEWVYWRHGYAHQHVDALTGLLMRSGMLVAATVLVLAFLAVVPRRHMWFTALGSATLYAYLLHGFINKPIAYVGWYDLPALHTVPGVIGVAVAAVVIGTLLCTKPVRRLSSWAVEPGFEWAFTALRRPRR